MNLERIKNNLVPMIFGFSIPSILAMVLNALITIVDGFFIGNYIGKEGIAAVNLGLPILYIYLGIGIMFSVGGIALAGISLGAGDLKRCNEVFNQTVRTVALISMVISIIILIFFKPILGFISSDVRVCDYFGQYYQIMIMAYPVMIVNSALGMFIRGEGKPQLFMFFSIISVISNIFLDYLFIKQFHFGIKGVAVASLLSLLISFSCMVCFFLKKSTVYKFQKVQISKSIVKSTILIGSAEFIGQMSMSISMFAYNFVILKKVGVAGVAAFTIVGYVAYLFNMVIIGFGQGASPLISFTFGAGESGLSKKIRKWTNLFVFLSGIIFILGFSIASNWYSSVFVKNEMVSTLIRSGLSIFMISFLFSGINTITTFYFTSIGKAKESALISSSRGLVVLLICIFTLPMLFGMTGIWLVAPVTEIITIAFTVLLIWNHEKKSMKLIS